MNMSYQAIVIEKARTMVDVLHDENFFSEYELNNDTFAMEYFCRKFTQKFIENGLDDDEIPFTEDQMDTYLREIIVGSIIYDLQDDGILDSVEDENNDERLFLTAKGKEYAKTLERNIDWDGLV